MPLTRQQLEKRRQALGLSRRELAEALGVSHQAVHTWETGTRPIPGMLALALQALEGEQS